MRTRLAANFQARQPEHVVDWSDDATDWRKASAVVCLAIAAVLALAALVLL